MYDLKTNSTFQQAMREAQERGKDNPLFKMADAIWDGVLVKEAERNGNGTDGGGGSVAWTKCALMGAQSLVWAWGATPEIVQEEFDYKNEIGYGWGMMAGVGKPAFNITGTSAEYGSLAVYVSRTQIN
jgi:hypothetical protein